MQKKLLAVAVAAAASAMMASPAAMAQSSVTISGVFKVGIDQWRVSNTARPRSNETRITDNSSRIIFGITEDMGGGLSGIAQLDARPTLDDSSLTAGDSLAGGNSWVGVRSNNLGTVTFGRHDLHYGKQPDDIASKAGALMSSSVSLMDYTYNGVAIAGATRTPNVIRYDSPNWSGFALTAAYSTNAGNEADMTSALRKGNAWTFNPSYTSGPFQIGFSHWNSKVDAGSATNGNQKSNVFYGYYRLGAFKIGAAINDSEVESVAAAGVAVVADRRVWTIPASWTMGPHLIAAHYTRAGEDKSAAAAGLDTKARMIAASYSYDLSKRTSMGVTLANINNGPAAAYGFFTNNTAASAAALGSAASPQVAGEDQRLMAFTVRHAF